MREPMCFGLHPRPPLVLGGVLFLAVAFCVPTTGRAQDQPPACGMLTAVGQVRVAAITVLPPTSDPSAQSQQGQPGVLSGAAPDTLAPSPTTPLDLPLPDSPSTSNGASPTASGNTLAGRGNDQDSSKNVAVTDTHRRFQYSLRLSVVGTYDDNIFLDSRNKRDDFYTVIQPGITVGFGDLENHVDNFVRLDYSAGAYLFATFDDQDTVQHLLRFDGQYHINKLTLNLTQSIQILDGADLTGTDNSGNQVGRVNLDVAGRTKVNIYNTSLRASYSLTGKTSLDAGFLYSLSDYDVLLSSEVYSADLYINYALSSKLILGIGVSGGYLSAEAPTPDETFEQLNLRLSYVLTEKLSFVGSVGIEGRQSDGRDGTQVTPVFNLSAVYLPFDGTSVGLSATRRVLSSAVNASQNYESSSFSLSVRQRLFTRFSLGLSGGYENDHYVSVRDRVNATRDDNYFYIQTGVDVTLRDHVSAGISYQHRENFSEGGGGAGFDDNQVSARVTISF